MISLSPSVSGPLGLYALVFAPSSLSRFSDFSASLGLLVYPLLSLCLCLSLPFFFLDCFIFLALSPPQGLLDIGFFLDLGLEYQRNASESHQEPCIVTNPRAFL